MRGFWGDFTDRMRAKAKALGKQNFFIFGEGFDGNDELIGSYTWGGTDADGTFGRFDSMFYFSQKYRGIDAVFAKGAADEEPRVPATTARDGPRRRPIAWCMAQRLPGGPDLSSATPHASSADGGIGLAPNQVLVNFLDNHDLPRFLFEKTDPRVLRSALAYLFTWDGIPCVYYGTEQGSPAASIRRTARTCSRGNPQQRLRAVRDRPRDVPARAGPDRDAQGQRRAPPRRRRTPVWSTTVAGPRRDAGHLRVRARSRRTRPRSWCSTRATSRARAARPRREGGACLMTTLPPGTTLTDVMPGSDGTTFTVAGNGTVAVTVPARSGRVLVRR